MFDNHKPLNTQKSESRLDGCFPSVSAIFAVIMLIVVLTRLDPQRFPIPDWLAVAFLEQDNNALVVDREAINRLNTGLPQVKALPGVPVSEPKGFGDTIFVAPVNMDVTPQEEVASVNDTPDDRGLVASLLEIGVEVNTDIQEQIENFNQQTFTEVGELNNYNGADPYGFLAFNLQSLNAFTAGTTIEELMNGESTKTVAEVRDTFGEDVDTSIEAPYLTFTQDRLVNSGETMDLPRVHVNGDQIFAVQNIKVIDVQTGERLSPNQYKLHERNDGSILIEYNGENSMDIRVVSQLLPAEQVPMAISEFDIRGENLGPLVDEVFDLVGNLIFTDISTLKEGLSSELIYSLLTKNVSNLNNMETDEFLGLVAEVRQGDCTVSNVALALIVETAIDQGFIEESERSELALATGYLVYSPSVKTIHAHLINMGHSGGIDATASGDMGVDSLTQSLLGALGRSSTGQFDDIDDSTDEQQRRIDDTDTGEEDSEGLNDPNLRPYLTIAIAVFGLVGLSAVLFKNAGTKTASSDKSDGASGLSSWRNYVEADLIDHMADMQATQMGYKPTQVEGEPNRTPVGLSLAQNASEAELTQSDEDDTVDSSIFSSGTDNPSQSESRDADVSNDSASATVAQMLAGIFSLRWREKISRFYWSLDSMLASLGVDVDTDPKLSKKKILLAEYLNVKLYSDPSKTTVLSNAPMPFFTAGLSNREDEEIKSFSDRFKSKLFGVVFKKQVQLSRSVFTRQERGLEDFISYNWILQNYREEILTLLAMVDEPDLVPLES